MFSYLTTFLPYQRSDISEDEMEDESSDAEEMDSSPSSSGRQGSQECGIMDDVVLRNGNQMALLCAANGTSTARKMAAGGDASEEEESYEDALEGLSVGPEKATCPPLEVSIREASRALDLFLSNHFNEALGLMKQWADVSMYHALGKGTVLFMQAVLTLESEDIETALDALHQAVEVCNRRRRRIHAMAYVSRLIRGTDYNALTREEVHAELCYAECLLEIAILTFVSDQSLVSFVRGGLRIRSCYQSYKECQQILECRDWEIEDQKDDFESGVRMGVGAFNLMISQLPSRILKLLEFIGFSGNKAIGLKELEEGLAHKDGLRSPLCALILIAYHTMVTYILGNGDGDIEASEVIINQMLKKYPGGALFLFFHGRLKQIQGKIDTAIATLRSSIAVQNEWRQFHYLCHWELLWCHCFQCDWENSCKSAEILRRECRWSPAVYTYLYSTMLYMMSTDLKKQGLTEEIHQLYKRVPTLRQRLAGKSLPVEKFSAHKSNKFFEQGGRLFLPSLEIMYVWNGFPMVGKAPELMERILKLIDKQPGISEDGEFIEDYCLALLLRAMCWKHMDRRNDAEDALLKIISLEKRIVDDLYLVPFATAEMGYMAMEDNRTQDALQWLDTAKHQYHNYPLETILHFRVHSALRALRGGADSNPSTPVHTPTESPFEEEQNA